MIFESLTCVYQNIREIMKSIEKDTGAKLVLSLSSDEDFDEGVLVLRGMESLMKKYDVNNAEVSITDGGLYKRAEFQLFGIKFSGYLDEVAI